MTVSELSADAKQLVAKLFLDADKPTHAVGRKQLVADLRANGIPLQIANRAIDELKSAGLLLTPGEVCAKIDAKNEGSFKIVEGKKLPIIIKEGQHTVVFGAWRAGDDGLIASGELESLLSSKTKTAGRPKGKTKRRLDIEAAISNKDHNKDVAASFKISLNRVAEIKREMVAEGLLSKSQKQGNNIKTISAPKRNLKITQRAV